MSSNGGPVARLCRREGVRRASCRASDINDLGVSGHEALLLIVTGGASR